MSAREKQETLKVEFVFIAPLTSKRPAYAGERALEAWVYELIKKLGIWRCVGNTKDGLYQVL